MTCFSDVPVRQTTLWSILMTQSYSRLFILAGAVLGASACTDTTTSPPSSLTQAALTAALASVPVGYGDLSTSYVGVTAANASLAGLWVGGGRDASFDRGGVMGGGFGGPLLGRHPLGRAGRPPGA